jgi:hypothetical protein
MCPPCWTPDRERSTEHGSQRVFKGFLGKFYESSDTQHDYKLPQAQVLTSMYPAMQKHDASA